ncbi:MAG: hypothetical protein FWD66_10370 [Paludibacter sp.]|nr:hypothetical protein [Paludibacter sp.]
MNLRKNNKVRQRECTASNEHIGKIAAAIPLERQCEFGSYYPARTFVKPLPRQYAGTLCARRATPYRVLFRERVQTENIMKSN